MSRLIDADAYSAEMKKRQDACEKLMHDAERWNDVELMRRANSAFSVFSEAKLTLDKIPTVDAVKHGEWKKILQNGDGTSDYECSACLGIIADVPDDDEHPLCSFCPNCGAKMDGNEQEDDN